MAQKIYVGNLPRGTANQALAEKFSKYGIVYSAKVVTEVEMTFALVEMASSEEAQKAIHDLDGSVIDGRLVNVKEIPKSYLH